MLKKAKGDTEKKSDTEKKGGTEKKSGAEKKAKSGSDGSAPASSPSSITQQKGEIDQKYVCPVGTCMKDPGRCAIFMAKHYQKLKYAVAGLLLGLLILTLVVYAVLCTHNQKEEKRRAKEDFELKVRSVYHGEDLF